MKFGHEHYANILHDLSWMIEAMCLNGEDCGTVCLTSCAMVNAPI